MSWEHVEDGFELPIGRAELLIYLAIARRADKRTHECFPSVRHLAEVTRYNEKYIETVISSLCRKGYLKKIKKRGRGQPTHYLVVGNKVGLSDLNETDEVGLSDLKKPMRSDNLPNEVRLSSNTNKDARAVLRESVIEPVIKEEKDIHTSRTDTSSEIPCEETSAQDEDLCVFFDDENAQDEEPDYSQMGRPEALCTYRNPMAACSHELEALAWMSDIEKYQVKRHPNLHTFLHEYSVEEFKLLFGWHLRHTEVKWRHLGNVCGQKAALCLKLAKEEQAERSVQAEAKRCHHERDYLILLRDTDAFTCKRCNAELSDAEAAERGVSRDDFDYDASEMLAELSNKLGMRFSA